jgi:hypothetical protein
MNTNLLKKKKGIYLDVDPCESRLFLLSLLHELCESCGCILFEGWRYSLVVIPPVLCVSAGTGGPVLFGRIFAKLFCRLVSNRLVEICQSNRSTERQKACVGYTGPIFPQSAFISGQNFFLAPFGI